MADSFIPLTPRQHSINWLIWYGIGLVLAFDFVWLWQSGVRLDFSKATIFFFVFAGCVALSLVYRYVRRDDQLYLLGHVTNQALLATVALGVLSYLSQRINFPLLDEQMIRLDNLFLFDWKTYVAWVDTQPWLAEIGSAAYFSSGPQIIIIVALLFITKHSAQIQRFLLAYFYAAVITIILAALLPAVGGYVHYDIDISAYQTIQPAAGRIHEAPLLGMRDHSITTFAFPLEGLITFPSFHSALSVLLIYASWPVRWLRAIVLPLNLVVLIATPVDGGHYLVDILAGVLVALIGIQIAGKLFPRGA